MLALALMLFHICRADTLELRFPGPLQQGVPLREHVLVFEDTADSFSADGLLHQPQRFQPLKELKPQHPTSTYWLWVPIDNQLAEPTADMVLFFTHLTFVEGFLYQGSQLLQHRYAGAFRPQKERLSNDGRFSLNFSFESGGKYILLLKVKHTKHYQPNFDFVLQSKDHYTAQRHQQNQLDMWMLGAVSIFFLYTLLSWLVSRFRPYLWLLFYIAGVSLYTITISGYFTDWFFPQTPETGWLFTIHFLHLGLLGVYLLIIDFWQLKQKSLWLYRWGLLVVAGVLLVSVTSFFINYFTSNYNLMNNINLWSYVLPFSFIAYTLWKCWRQLDRAQRFLGYGIMLFALGGVVTTLGSALLHEKFLLMAPYITYPITLGVVVLFATGLKEELRLAEIDKNAALQQLNHLQLEQNTLLDQKVRERTKELLAQQGLLADRNSKIEILINELNHRVKNNLQLLYSLIHLQLPRVQDPAAREMLKGNSAKIRAMMLVNDQLSRFEDQATIQLQTFSSDLIHYVQSIYDQPQKVQLAIQIPGEIELSGKETLSFGLILSELLTNSFKYAFSDQPNPQIEIRVQRSDASTLQFVYADNGKGLASESLSGTSSMGLMLIRDLARQMNGTVDVQNHTGLTYMFAFTI